MEDEDFNPESPEWYAKQEEAKHQELLRMMMGAVQNGEMSISDFQEHLLQFDIEKKLTEKIRRTPPKEFDYSIGVDPGDLGESIIDRPITPEEAFNPENPEMKRELLNKMSTESLKLLYEMLGHSRIPKDNERVQYINQIVNHSFSDIKRLCDGEIKRIEEQQKTSDYLKELHIEQLATILDRLDVKYGILESGDQIIEYLIRHFNFSSIRKVHEDFHDTYDGDSITQHVFNKFIRRRSDEEVRMLLNMVGWDIDEDDTDEDLRKDLYVQEYAQVYNFYLQLKNII